MARGHGLPPPILPPDAAAALASPHVLPSARLTACEMNAPGASAIGSKPRDVWLPRLTIALTEAGAGIRKSPHTGALTNKLCAFFGHSVLACAALPDATGARVKCGSAQPPTRMWWE